MAEAKTALTAEQNKAIRAALDLQSKSLERAARAQELAGKTAIASAIRTELQIVVNLKGHFV